MSNEFNIDASEITIFLNNLCEQAQNDFKNEIETWLDALGIEFLRVVEDEIIRKEVVDTRLLLNSFHKGDGNNVWEIESEGLQISLEIGTNIEYAKNVNDGHSQKKRFVPGKWEGDKFTYIPNANTGMMLTEKFIEGKHYFESACVIFETIFNKSLERKLERWIAKYDRADGS